MAMTQLHQLIVSMYLIAEVSSHDSELIHGRLEPGSVQITHIATC